MNIWVICLFILSICILSILFLGISNNYYINDQIYKNVNENSSGSKYIPKKIYQLVQDKNNINSSFKKNIEYIKELNENWVHILYDDDDMIAYMKENYPPYILKVYNMINHEYGAARADFFRYLLMYREGGVYLDIKSYMKYALDGILKENDEFILSHWACPCQSSEVDIKEGEFQQWFIICKPNHPYLKKVIEDVIDNIIKYDVKKDGIGKQGVLKVTGPIQYTKSILPMVEEYNHTIYESNEYIGLVYNNMFNSHINLFSQKHYSKLDSPIIIK
jgi:mannosyltransferase OCH1-like enzyme